MVSSSKCGNIDETLMGLHNFGQTIRWTGDGEFLKTYSSGIKKGLNWLSLKTTKMEISYPWVWHDGDSWLGI